MPGTGRTAQHAWSPLRVLFEVVMFEISTNLLVSAAESALLPPERLARTAVHPRLCRSMRQPRKLRVAIIISCSPLEIRLPYPHQSCEMLCEEKLGCRLLTGRSSFAFVPARARLRAFLQRPWSPIVCASHGLSFGLPRSYTSLPAGEAI